MNNLQKLIAISLLAVAGLSWILSSLQPDMMSLMTAYNPVSLSIFILSWTIGMAAMMFPAIVPMVLLYDKLITNKQSDSSTVVSERKFNHTIKIIFFIGVYLLIWALTGLGLLIAWSIPFNTFSNLLDSKQMGIIFGSIMIVSGLYQFASIKNRCIAYCESPLSFFMRRWKSGTVGAIKMGAYHGLYCLGCCWPYFLIMIALGWMSLTWMALFALIIFGEKIWAKGIWIARAVGIAFIIIGISSTLGIITIYDKKMFMDDDLQNSKGAGSMLMQQNNLQSKNSAEIFHENSLTSGNATTVTPGMKM